MAKNIKCFTSFVTKEMQIKTTMIYYLITIKIAMIKRDKQYIFHEDATKPHCRRSLTNMAEPTTGSTYVWIDRSWPWPHREVRRSVEVIQREESIGHTR